MSSFESSLPCSEKFTAEIKIRTPESMRDLIMRLAFEADRSPSEYVRHVLALHLYGHARRMTGQALEGEGPNVPFEGTRNNPGGQR